MKKYILHIPHASTFIPDRSFFVESQIKPEMDLITDWNTDKIFNIPETEKIMANFSRLFCDVERLPDKDESMYKKGLGFYYTDGEYGQLIRRLDKKHKEDIYRNYYKPHHNLLTKAVDIKLKSLGRAVIIDCHSFSSYPLLREDNKNPVRPDICLGVDSYHTPTKLFKKFESFFKKHSLTVAINKPYSGTIVPLKHYKKRKEVESIMIEINKKLYMDEKYLVFFPEKVKWLNGLITNLLHLHDN